MKKDIADELNEKSGKTIAFYGNDRRVEKVDVIPTGIMPLDFALGTGGIPRGRITDIYGLPSVGKSTICFTLMAQAHKLGLECALVDAEYSYYPEYVKSFGVDTDKLLVIQPDCFEEAAEAIEAMVRNKTGLIVIDSVSSLVPRPEAEAEHGKAPMAIQARLMSQMLRKIVSPVSKNNTALVCINQMRVNMMSTNPYDKYTVTGGWALKFYSSVRIEVKKLTAIMGKKGEEQLGYNTGFTIKKNKLARPGLSCEIPYLFGEGFNADGDIVEMAVKKGLITQQGAWYVMGEKKWQGKAKAESEINSDPALRDELISVLFPRSAQ